MATEMSDQLIQRIIAESPRDHLLATILRYGTLQREPAMDAYLRRIEQLSTEELRDLCSQAFREAINNAKVLYISTGQQGLLPKRLLDYLVELSNQRQ